MGNLTNNPMYRPSLHYDNLWSQIAILLRDFPTAWNMDSHASSAPMVAAPLANREAIQPPPELLGYFHDHVEKAQELACDTRAILGASDGQLKYYYHWRAMVRTVRNVLWLAKRRRGNLNDILRVIHTKNTDFNLMRKVAECRTLQYLALGGYLTDHIINLYYSHRLPDIRTCRIPLEPPTNNDLSEGGLPGDISQAMWVAIRKLEPIPSFSLSSPAASTPSPSPAAASSSSSSPSTATASSSAVSEGTRHHPPRPPSAPLRPPFTRATRFVPEPSPLLHDMDFYRAHIKKMIAKAMGIQQRDVEAFTALTPVSTQIAYETLRLIHREATECFLLQGTRAGFAVSTVEEGIAPEQVGK